MKKKPWTGKKAAKRRHRMIRDSFQLPRELRTRMLKASKAAGVSKAQLLRWGCTIVLQAVQAKLDGETEIIIKLGDDASV